MGILTAPSPAADGSSYAASVMADAPRAYWRLGESSGATALSETGTNAGTYQGGVRLSQPGALLNDPNRAVSLDGTDDTVLVPHASSLVPAGALALEAWVRPSRLPTGQNVMTVMRKGSQYQLALLSNGRVRFGVGLGQLTKETTSPKGSVAVGGWFHVVGTWSGSSIAVWVDAVKVSETQVIGTVVSGTAPLYLGSSSATGERFAGLIDEAAVYGAALSAARIAAHRDAASPPPPDTTPPTVTLTQPAQGSTTTDATPTFAGAAGTATGDVASVSLSIYTGTAVSGSPVETLSAPASTGTWTVDASPALAPGTYTAQARQSDSAGNVGQSQPVTLTVQAPPPPDTTAPTVTLTEPTAGSTTSDTTPRFGGGAGTAAGDAAAVTLAVYSGTTATGSPVETLNAPATGGSWSVDASPALAAGTYTAQARQSDGAGNVGQSTAVSFTILAPPPSYRSTVMADQPSAYWRLGEATGTVAADELGASPGAYRNGGTLGSAGALGGDSNTAAELDGVNDTVRVLSLPSLGGAFGISFEAWLKPTQLPAASATIVRKDGQYLLRLGSDGSLRLRVWKGGAITEITTAPHAAPAGAWRHVAFSYDGAMLRLFVDGVQVASTALAGPVDVSTASLYLGSSLESYDWLAATLDEVAVYDHALPAERVRAHVDAAARPLGDNDPPLVTLTTPADGSTTTDSTPALAGAAGTAVGDSASVSVSIYAGAIANGTPLHTLTATASGGSWARDADVLAVGTYTAQAKQLDAAGNIGVSRPATFSIVAGPVPTGYKAAVLADSPRGYWRLDEAAGTTAVDQTAAHPGSYRNGVALGRPGALFGDASTAVALDGLDDSVRVPDGPGLSSSTGMAVEAWLRPTMMPSSTATIARKDGQYLLRLGSNGTITFRIWKGGVVYEAVSTPGVAPQGEWTHVVASWDGSEMRTYADAVLVATRAFAGPADLTTASLSLGSTLESYDWLTGLIDEVAVYAAPLPAARVLAHFNAAEGGVDMVAPIVTLPAPAGGSTMDSLPNFGGQAGRVTGDSADVTVRVYSGTSATGTPVRTLGARRSASGTFSLRAGTPLAAGTYTAQAEQLDAAGNAGRSAPTTFSVAAGDPVILAAGDIAGCDTTGDEATAALLDRLPGTVTTLGEHAYENNTDEDFANCYDPSWGRHKARTIPTIGGHEYLSPNAAPYFSYFGSAAGDPAKGYYSYELGNWHVVSLNTSCSAVGGCEAGSAMERWLRQDLLAHPAACTVAMMHEPRFSSGAIHGGSFANEDLFQALYDAGAEMVLSGDDHLYERFAPQATYTGFDPLGVRQFVVGTGGRSHYAFGPTQPNSEAQNNDAFGVLKLTLHPGSYDWSFVAEAGKTFTDTGSAVCH